MLHLQVIHRNAHTCISSVSSIQVLNSNEKSTAEEKNKGVCVGGGGAGNGDQDILIDDGSDGRRMG
jgi:hypothetical protein